jgi:hypothetical protein
VFLVGVVIYEIEVEIRFIILKIQILLKLMVRRDDVV